MNVNIETIVVGNSRTNCYIIWDEDEVVVIDPGDDGPKINKVIKSHVKEPIVKILVTNGLAGSIGAIPYLLEKYTKAEVFAGRAENLFLFDSNANLSIHMGINIDLTHYSSNIKNIASGDEVSAGKYHFRVMETPGISPGSVIYILDDEEIVFTGMTIMKGIVGPTCFPYGDAGKLYTSIKERILVLPKNFAIYPGYGPKSKISEEASTNPYVLTMQKSENEM
ncbi:metallo-beta-lactamase superfamily protein [Trichomonas vaginalis G3]|uniref:Metallo-beta-lactamase superfamily protein n=1 Tax=Trichomonas vaginalis (strain ATCC PRA-98 / G3) TaxID=412133 RepID=A2DXP6_TRIV3|nr:sulfur dioxygenase protein [Trichomonas vaginalis G3]EAY14875.1 metallo-beta-lactamase superfamily protein [Trichomonas vaginalis G3]KAI5541144.1 sulfur dioxygenase protein [Trichomonas vaginalis G3]|eukprot:XP_001327098.1 metallo-beta-lactamase superfamily protein [Trichomonas vaginalis G3]